LIVLLWGRTTNWRTRRPRRPRKNPAKPITRCLFTAASAWENPPPASNRQQSRPRFPRKKIRYVPTEKLTTEIINAIRGGTIQELRAKYLDTAVFIVDDIQFISGKDKTQDEFFYLFNTLYNKNLQIVLSSDRPPKAITELSDRLRSRFEGGMIADISLPDFETRMAILKEKCQVMKIDLSDEILSAIAGTIQNNVRELEGALTKIAAHFKLKKNHQPPKPAGKFWRRSTRKK